MSSLSSCTPPGMGSLKKLCFKVIIISRLLIFELKNQVHCFNQGLSIAVHGQNRISPLFYRRFMQGRQQPGQEKRYFLEQEESTGYLPVFRNIRLEKNIKMIELRIDCSIHWCTGCHTLSTTTWMSQCWCLTGRTLLVSSGLCLIKFLTKGLCRTHGWVALTTLAGWRSLDLIQVGNLISELFCLLNIYFDTSRHRQGPTRSRWRSFQ